MKNIGKIGMSILLLAATLLGHAACNQNVVTGTGTTAGSTTAPPITTAAQTTILQSKEPRPPMDYIFESAVPKAAKQATTLYLIGEPSNFSDKVTLATLQGLVANLSEEQILIQGGAYNNYKDYLTKNWNCTVASKVDGKSVSLSNLLAHYKDSLSGYILAADDSASDSGNVAISLAGLLNAVVVTPKNQSLCDELGLTCLMDTTDKDDAWLRASEYWEQLSRTTAVEQPLNMAPKLVDYAVMSRSYFSFYNGRNSTEHRQKYSFLNDNAIVLGYNNTLGEYDTVLSFSADNIQMIPADHAYNLSTLSGFKTSILDQKTATVVGERPEKVHTVCIILSDGDNVQWLTNDFTTSNKWWANSNRGKFNMGWGLPATAIDLVPPMASYLYDTMSTRDEFVMQLSGLGYTFPSRWSTAARQQMAVKLSEYMERSDLHYAEILDDNGLNERTISAFTAQDGIDGLFYIDYSNYAGKAGQILWTNNKPTVAARYRLWANTSDGSIEAISRAVNRASTDPTKAASYSFIIVHAWSGMNGSELAESGNTMDAVAKLVKSFDDNVEVVTPSEFMHRIITNQAK